MNYVMDKAHPALSHQYDVVEALAKEFDYITVLTGQDSTPIKATNVRVVSTNWVPGQNARNLVNFYLKFFSLIRHDKYISVFSHMTLVQSFLAAPFLRLKRISHFLWYAHAQNSHFLRLTHFFLKALITSTSGSCPINSSKVIYLGQAVNPVDFSPRASLRSPLIKMVHVGRLDNSKNLPVLIQVTSNVRQIFPQVSLELIGSPSTELSRVQLLGLQDLWSEAMSEGWLKFSPPVLRSDLSVELSRHDIFLHAFLGSLDKSVVEATMSGMPVVTINKEYITEFGYWGVTFDSLETELISLLELPVEAVRAQTEKRLVIALESHTFKSWVTKLTSILLNGAN